MLGIPGMASGSVPLLRLAFAKPIPELLKTTHGAIADVGHNRLGGGLVVRVASEVAILDHLHPAFTIFNQAEPECFSQGVA